MTKLESTVKKTSWNNLATFEDQLGFCAQKESANFDHPPRDRQSDTCPPRTAKDTEEIAVRQRMWRGEVDRPGNVLSLNQEFDCANEVRLVNP